MKASGRKLRYLLAVTFLFAFAASNVAYTGEHKRIELPPSGGELVGDELLVKFKPALVGGPNFSVASVHQAAGASARKSYRDGLQKVTLSGALSIEQALEAYRANPNVEYAEPNYTVYTTAVAPNDADFDELWGLRNKGHFGGVPGADINAPAAWDIVTGGENAVIAVVDTGVDYNHPDLAANMWTNPHEIAGDGIDNDGNGYIDDVHGVDTANNDGDPMDDQSHGTHVAGTIGAVGDNGIGVAGVNWDASIIACKFLKKSGSGKISDAIECLDYLLDLKQRHGVNIVATNNSWGSKRYSQALEDAVSAHTEAGILFVAAAGNTATRSKFYPAALELDNVISVAATDRKGRIATFSNYGRDWVDIAAPGVSILSTLPNGDYGWRSGTSMAAPHVTGLAGLLYAQDPLRDYRQLKSLILSSGHVSADPLVRHQTLSGRDLLAAGDGGEGALTCSGRQLQAPMGQRGDHIFLRKHQQLELAVYSVDCGSPAVPFPMIAETAELLAMEGAGMGAVAQAGDGVFSTTWTFPGDTTYTIQMAGSELSVVPAPHGEQKLVPQESGGQFGTALAMDHEFAIAGAPLEDGVGGVDTGAAYVYRKIDGAWMPDHRLAPEGLSAWDRFGKTVALSGEFAFIAAPYVDNQAFDAGLVYVYQREGNDWTMIQSIAPSVPAQFAHFGRALSADGGRVVVGASGAAYVFEWDGVSWVQTEKLPQPNITAYTNPVALHRDWLALASEDAVDVYWHDGMQWLSWQTIMTPHPQHYAFARSVSIADDVLVVGAPGESLQGEVHVYRLNSGSWWVKETTLRDGTPDFGRIVGAQDSAIAVGQEGDDLADGAISVYTLGSHGWQPRKLASIDAVTGARFGSSLAMAANEILVGAPRQDENGAAYAFTPTDTTAPVAHAGDSQIVYESQIVMLDGSASYDTDGVITGYEWRQLSGPYAKLVFANTATPRFTAPQVAANELLTFELTVSDHEGAQHSRIVSVSVLPNGAPLIREGEVAFVTAPFDQRLHRLTFSAADPENHALTWRVSDKPAQGKVTASGIGESVTVDYDAGSGFAGSDSFVVEVIDAFGRTDEITVEISDGRTPGAVVGSASGGGGAMSYLLWLLAGVWLARGRPLPIGRSPLF